MERMNTGEDNTRMQQNGTQTSVLRDNDQGIWALVRASPAGLGPVQPI